MATEFESYSERGKRKIKKRVTGILVVMAVIWALTACGNEEKMTNTDPGNTPEKAGDMKQMENKEMKNGEMNKMSDMDKMNKMDNPKMGRQEMNEGGMNGETMTESGMKDDTQGKMMNENEMKDGNDGMKDETNKMKNNMEKKCEFGKNYLRCRSGKGVFVIRKIKESASTDDENVKIAI